MPEIKDIVKDVVAKVDTVQTDREKLDAVNNAISKIKLEINSTQDDIKKGAESLQIIMGKLWSGNKQVVGQGAGFEDIDMSSLNDEQIIDMKDAKNELHLDAILLFRELTFLYQNNQNPESFLLYEKRLNDTQGRNDRNEYIKKLNELPDKVIGVFPNPTSGEINITVDYSIIGVGSQEYMDVIRPFKPGEGGSQFSFNILPTSTTINPLEDLPIIEQNGYSNNTEHIMGDYKDGSTTFNNEYDLHKNIKQENIVVEGSLNIVSMNGQPVLAPVNFKMDKDEDHQYTFDLSSLPAGVYIIKIPEIQVFGKPLMKKVIKQ